MGDQPQREPKVTYGVLPKKLGGGPHNLGDPNDRSLRKVEKDVLVMQKLRDKTRIEKCVPEVKAFSECCRAESFAMVFMCRKETKALTQCCEKWYKDEKFIAECTEEYLVERSEYRRTGLSKKEREHRDAMKRIASNM